MARRRFSTEALARASSRHPWRTIVIWFVALVLSVAAFSTLLADVLSNDFDFTNNPDSKRADALIAERLLGGEEEVEAEPILVRSEGAARVGDPEFQTAVNHYVHDFEAMLRRVLAERDGGMIAVTLMSSDMGKLYAALAQAVEKRR